jgi:hypothetical protein
MNAGVVMLDARTQLDRQYLEMRGRILSLAADFDRIERLPGGADLMKSDPRIAGLRACIGSLLENQPGRSERVQLALSDGSALQ